MFTGGMAKLAELSGYKGHLIDTLQVQCYYQGLILRELSRSNTSQYALTNPLAQALSFGLVRVQSDVTPEEIMAQGKCMSLIISALGLPDGWSVCPNLNAIKSVGHAIMGVVSIPGPVFWPIESTRMIATIIHQNDDWELVRKLARTNIERATMAVSSSIPQGDLATDLYKMAPGMTLSSHDARKIHRLIEATHADATDAIKMYEKGRNDGKEEVIKALGGSK